MSDLAFQSTVQLAAGIRNKDVGSRELLDLYLDRIERLNPPLNAIVTMDVEGARAAADAADTALARGDVLGPLHGVPMTVKDNMSVAGMRSTAGAPILSDYVPEEDGTIAQRLKAAGAIIFGKANMPTFGMDAQTYNDIFGVTNNPWDTSRTCGGSSGGSAVALAAGLTGFEVGTDIGGSIRVPAHYCGVYGHKSTFGILPRRGHLGMPGARSYSDISVIGPMGRSAADLGLGLDVLAGADPQDAGVGWTLTLPPPRQRKLKDFRVAVWLENDYFPVDRAVLQVLDAAVTTLEDAGANVNRSARPNFDAKDAYDNYVQLLIGAVSPGRSDDEVKMLQAMGPDLSDADGSYASIVAVNLIQTHRDWLLRHEYRERLRARWYEFFREYDVLLCPASAVPAFPHNIAEDMTVREVLINGTPQPYLDLVFWSGITCNCYLPAVSAPAGRTAEGLPVGIQIVGPYLEDRTAIAFAEQFEAVVGGFQPPPGY